MTIVEYLNQHTEPLPEWLNQSEPKFDREKFFNSRTVYYPGSDNDGEPVRICAQSHVAHTFIYVDYDVSIAEIRNRVNGVVAEEGFRGYKVENDEPVAKTDLSPSGWVPHLAPSELKDINKYPAIEPFGLFVSLLRDANLGDDHGPERLGILFIGGEGIATYDALYCQEHETPPPFMVVSENHSYGDGSTKFGAGGPLDKLTNRTDSCPNYLLVSEDSSHWSGYEDTGAGPEIWGISQTKRSLFRCK